MSLHHLLTISIVPSPLTGQECILALQRGLGLSSLTANKQLGSEHCDLMLINFN